MKSKILKHSKIILFRLTSATSWYEVVIYLYNKYLKNNTRFDEIFFGDLTKEDDYDPRDWWLDRSSFEDLPQNFNDSLYIFDQWKEFRTRNACVPVNVMSAHYNNHPWLNLDYEKVHEFINWCEDEWIWKENSWANTPTVVNAYVRKWNEENPNNKIASERIWYTSPAWRDAIKKWYQIVGSRITFPQYNEDKVNGRKINLTDYSDKAARWWHCQTFIGWNFLLWGSNFLKRQIHIHSAWTTEISTTTVWDWINCVNSYPETHREFNVYWHSLLEHHCRNGIWRGWFYVIYPIENREIEKPKSDYDKYLERGYIENPQPERVMTERLYGTFRERELRAEEKK